MTDGNKEPKSSKTHPQHTKFFELITMCGSKWKLGDISKQTFGSLERPRYVEPFTEGWISFFLGDASRVAMSQRRELATFPNFWLAAVARVAWRGHYTYGEFDKYHSESRPENFLKTEIEIAFRSQGIMQDLLRSVWITVGTTESTHYISKYMAWKFNST